MKRPLSVCLALIVAMSFTSLPGVAQSSARYFTETQHNVSGGFLEYWSANGGLAQQGFPLTEEFSEQSLTNGQTYNVQYFERAVFEYHPEVQGPNKILLSLLGSFLYNQKYPGGAPNQTPNQVGGRRFPETNHWVGGRFLQYWTANGGLAQQGYPISDEFDEQSPIDGKIYRVQYFERSVFEYHPENAAPNDVLLSQLGKFQLRARYPNNSNAAAQPAQPIVAAPVPTQAPASNIPSDPQAFADYAAAKYRKVGNVGFFFDVKYGAYVGKTVYVTLGVYGDTAVKLLNNTTEADGQSWGEAVYADAKAAWPNNDAVIQLQWITYSDNLCTRQCVTSCYYQGTDYRVGQGWYTAYTLARVNHNMFGGVQTCGYLKG